MVITSYRTPLAPVTSFKYLERVLLSAHNYYPVVVHNLWRAHHKWSRLSRVLIREVADDRTLRRIYRAVVQAVMMYRLETWLMIPLIGRVLGEFDHRVA